MNTTFVRGVRAEESARLYLERKGYTLIAARYKTPHGEIDLLMRDGQAIVAVEVKYRKYESDSFECLTPRQQKRIENALLHYLSEQNITESGANSSLLRFDVVLLSARAHLTHIENAW
ncbi:MAG: YraN family protein [Pseudomonadota bacterium]